MGRVSDAHKEVFAESLTSLSRLEDVVGRVEHVLGIRRIKRHDYW